MVFFLSFHLPQGTNSSAVVDAILELVNVTMKGKLYTGHEKSCSDAKEI